MIAVACTGQRDTLFIYCMNSNLLKLQIKYLYMLNIIFIIYFTLCLRNLEHMRVLHVNSEMMSESEVRAK